jgi:hypothetical protein
MGALNVQMRHTVDQARRLSLQFACRAVGGRRGVVGLGGGGPLMLPTVLELAVM